LREKCRRGSGRFRRSAPGGWRRSAPGGCRRAAAATRRRRPDRSTTRSGHHGRSLVARFQHIESILARAPSVATIHVHRALIHVSSDQQMPTSRGTEMCTQRRQRKWTIFLCLNPLAPRKDPLILPPSPVLLWKADGTGEVAATETPISITASVVGVTTSTPCTTTQTTKRRLKLPALQLPAMTDGGAVGSIMANAHS